MNLRTDLLYVTLSLYVYIRVCVFWQIFHWVERQITLGENCHLQIIVSASMNMVYLFPCCSILTFFICTLLWRNPLLFTYMNDFAEPSFLGWQSWIILSVFPFSLCWFNSCFPFSCTLWYFHSYGLPVGTFQMLPDPWAWKMERGNASSIKMFQIFRKKSWIGT